MTTRLAHGGDWSCDWAGCPICDPRGAIHPPSAVRPLTEAGQRLLGREAYNSRSFALIRDEDIVAIEAEVRANLLDRLRRVHYPPQIGTHYEQGFADCLRAVLAEFERP